MTLTTTEDDLPLTNYDRQSAGAITAKLRAFSQRELQIIGAYEARHANREVILDRVAELMGAEPWPGYDDLSGAAITAAVDEATAARVLVYERAHKARAAVIQAASERSRAVAG